MMMILKVVTTGGCNSVELMIGQRMTELSAGCCEGIVGYKGDGGYLIMYIIDCLQVREKHIGNLFF